MSINTHKIPSRRMYTEKIKFGLSLDPPRERQEKVVATELRLLIS